MAEALLRLGVSRGSSVGIFSENRPEWLIVQYGCYLRSLVPVPLYATLGGPAVAHIVTHAELAVIFCSSAVLSSLSDAILSSSGVPRWIICFDGPDGVEVPEKLKLKLPAARLMFWSEVVLGGNA